MALVVEQFKALLSSPYIGEEEKKQWLGLIPDLTEDDLRELTVLLSEQQEIALSLAAEVKKAALQPRAPTLRRFDVEDFLTLNFAQLKDPSTLQKMRNLILEIEREKDIGRAVDLLRYLQEQLAKFPAFGEDEPKLADEYKGLQVELKYFVFPTLIDKDAEELLKVHLRFGLESEGFDIKERIDARAFFYHDEATGGEQRRMVTRAVRENEEMVGSERLEISGEKGFLAPTIKNWLRDYELFFEKPGPRSTVEEVTYVNQNKNAKKITDIEKEFLLKVLGFYDFLMFPPAVVRELRAPQRKVGEAEIPAGAPAPKAPLTSEDIARIYQGNPVEEEAIKKEEKEISKLKESQKRLK
jgi:glutathione S-transferase